jgi:hypothetical protein
MKHIGMLKMDDQVVGMQGYSYTIPFLNDCIGSRMTCLFLLFVPSTSPTYRQSHLYIVPVTLLLCYPDPSLSHQQDLPTIQQTTLLSLSEGVIRVPEYRY